MGWSGNQNRTLPDCPICGLPQGAFMGSTEWYPFTESCCSKECGIKGRNAIICATNTAAYKIADIAENAATIQKAGIIDSHILALKKHRKQNN